MLENSDQLSDRVETQSEPEIQAEKLVRFDNFKQLIIELI